MDYKLALFILVGFLGGAELGARILVRLREAYVRYYFPWIIFIAIGIIFLSSFLLRVIWAVNHKDGRNKVLSNKG